MKKILIIILLLISNISYAMNYKDYKAQMIIEKIKPVHFKSDGVWERTNSVEYFIHKGNICYLAYNSISCVKHKN